MGIFPGLDIYIYLPLANSSPFCVFSLSFIFFPYHNLFHFHPPLKSPFPKNPTTRFRQAALLFSLIDTFFTPFLKQKCRKTPHFRCYFFIFLPPKSVTTPSFSPLLTPILRILSIFLKVSNTFSLDTFLFPYYNPAHPSFQRKLKRRVES